MKKYDIGYTTGVFDMFHIGHLNVLENAKKLCNFLIVGVSTDEVVQSYKNKKPIIPFKERFAIVKALKCVDLAVPQESMNKMDAWERLRFNVLFHGSEWKDTEMYKQIVKEFKAVDVDVIFLPHTDGISSTLLSNVLHKLYKD